ncbi:MAG TPA: phosphatase PAP2 family protein [Ktedonobacteraceae bacterium]|nr:phosphatase PAP2 family protein [Ktedonobacteraceae bacterium]
MQQKKVDKQYEQNTLSAHSDPLIKPDDADTAQDNTDAPLNEKVGENIQEVVDKAEQEVDRTRLPWYRASKRAYTLIGVDAIVLVLFALLAWWVHIHPVLAIDVTITHEFQENQNPWLSGLMFAVSWLGFQFVLFTAMIVVTAIIFWILHLRLEAIIIIAVNLVSTLLNGLIKVIVARPRPSAHLVDVLYAVSGQSFPSGHVMAYMAYFGLLLSFGIILFRRDRWWHYLFLIIPAAFVVLIGPSRIYLGDHWATDVLGAYLIAIALLSISLFIYLKLKERGVLSSPLEKGRHLFNVGHKR